MTNERDLLMSELLDTLIYNEYFSRLVSAKDNVIDIIYDNKNASIQRVIQLNELLNEVIRMLRDLEQNYAKLRAAIRDRDDRLQNILKKIDEMKIEIPSDLDGLENF
jgi:chromosome segregation ATPase